MNTTTKLLLLSLIVGISNSLFPVFSILGKGKLTLFQFTAIWYLSALFFYTIFFFHSKTTTNNLLLELKIVKEIWIYFIAFLIVNTTAIFIMYESLAYLNSNTFTFLLGSGIVFNILFSYTFLDERDNIKITIISVLIIIAGFTMLRYSLNIVENKGLTLMVFATLLFALSNIIVKKKLDYRQNNRKISNELIGAIKALFIFLISTLFLIINSKLNFSNCTTNNFYLVIGAFIGPFLGYILVIKLLREFGLSAMTIYKSSEYTFAAIWGIIIFNQHLTVIQTFGTILILLGIFYYNYHSS